MNTYWGWPVIPCYLHDTKVQAEFYVVLDGKAINTSPPKICCQALILSNEDLGFESKTTIATKNQSEYLKEFCL